MIFFSICGEGLSLIKQWILLAGIEIRGLGRQIWWDFGKKATLGFCLLVIGYLYYRIFQNEALLPRLAPGLVAGVGFYLGTALRGKLLGKKSYLGWLQSQGVSGLWFYRGTMGFLFWSPGFLLPSFWLYSIFFVLGFLIASLKPRLNSPAFDLLPPQLAWHLRSVLFLNQISQIFWILGLGCLIPTHHMIWAVLSGSCFCVAWAYHLTGWLGFSWIEKQAGVTDVAYLKGLFLFCGLGSLILFGSWLLMSGSLSLAVTAAAGLWALPTLMFQIDARHFPGLLASTFLVNLMLQALGFYYPVWALALWPFLISYGFTSQKSRFYRV